MNRLKYIAAAVWLGVIGLSYYRLFPFAEILPVFPHGTPHPAFGAVMSLACLALILIAANGWGRFFWLSLTLPRTERFIFATGTGLGCIALVVLAAGMFGVVSPLLYLTLLLSGFILFISCGTHLRGGRSAPLLALLAGALLPLAATLIGALAPPTQFDSLVYHLALPEQYVMAGKIGPVAHNMFFSFPQNGEMLYQLALVMDGDILANLLAWSFYLLTGMTVFAGARRYYGTRTGVIAGLLWFFTPTIMLLATGTYVDLLLTYYVALSLYGFLLWRERGDRIWLAAAGIFAGLALGTKYTAAAPMLAIVCLIVLHDYRRSLRNTALFVAPALLVFLPWLIKNALYLGNPIAPWAAGISGASAISPGMAQGYFAHIRGHGLGVAGIRDLVEIPWNLTVSGVKYGGGFDILGPAFLLFLPLLFLRRKIDRITRNLLLFCVFFCALWLLTGKVLRFMVPVLPVFCILAAAGVTAFASARWRAMFACVLLVIMFLHNALFFHWVMSFVDPYSPVLLGESRDVYLARKLPSARAVAESVNELPSGSRVIFLGETRGYYCRLPAVVPTVFDDHPLIAMANAAASSRELAVSLRREHFTHVLENAGECARLGLERRFTAQGLKNWSELKESGARMLYADSRCRVYEINH